MTKHLVQHTARSAVTAIAQIALYYPVPSNLKSFGVTFMGKQVANGAAP